MKKIGLISLALVLALGALGVGFAAWTDEVFITQTVETGTVSIGFSKARIVWIEQEKDVASATAALTGEILGQDSMGRDIFPVAEFVISNAYPCVLIEELVDIASAGTIPVHISGFKFKMQYIPEVGPPEDLDVVVIGGTGEPGDALQIHFYENGELVMKLWLVNAVGVQLHEGDFTALEIHKKFEQPMRQNALYKMWITVTGIQYNKG